MRIVAGEFKGRQLVVPAGLDVRPTSDRVRESLFNILAHGVPGFSLAGAKVIDLFAGSGALGLEALSRGAASVLFVEMEAAARGAIRANVEALQLEGRTRLFRRDATRLGPAGAGDSFDLAFLDPPYGRGLADLALSALVEGGWLAKGAVVVVEEAEDAPPIAWPKALDALPPRIYGGTALHIAHLEKAAPEGRRE